MISIVRSGPNHSYQECSVEDLTKLLEDSTKEECTLWIDLDTPSNEEEDRVLRDVFDFHPLAISDCRHGRTNSSRGDHLPKVEDYNRYIFTITNAVDMEKHRSLHHQRLTTRQINAFIGETFLVTHHYEHSPAIEATTTLCRKNAMLLERGPDYIYHLILDRIVDQFAPILDGFDADIEQLEYEVFHAINGETLQKILSTKRDVYRMRRISTYQREMVNRLSRGEFPLVTEKEIAYYRNVYDHLVRAAELAESYRDILSNLVDAYLSMTSQRLNEIMKVLTLLSSFFLPLTFIAGIYGMNFDIMPELNWRYGYLFAIGLMVATAIGMFIFFRKKKWL